MIVAHSIGQLDRSARERPGVDIIDHAIIAAAVVFCRDLDRTAQQESTAKIIPTTHLKNTFLSIAPLTMSGARERMPDARDEPRY
jgi:hypothetical protein